MNNEDNLEVLRKLNKKPEYSQRELAKELNFSLGKLNYCLKSLKNKGLIKINNFKKNPNKLNYIYVLTPKGIAEKTKLTMAFMKRKMVEYDEFIRSVPLEKWRRGISDEFYSTLGSPIIDVGKIRDRYETIEFMRDGEEYPVNIYEGLVYTTTKELYNLETEL